MKNNDLALKVTKCLVQELKKENKTKSIARICEIDENYVERLAYAQDKKLTLESFLRLLAEYQPEKTYELLGEISNCIIVPLPEAERFASNVALKKATEVMKEAIATFEIVQESIEDEVYTEDEKRKTCLEINKTIQVLTELKSLVYSC